MLFQGNGQALLYAGGTELFPRMKYGLSRCRGLISLKGIAPREPEINAAGELVLDALTALNRIAENREVRAHSPVLAQAARAVASNQIRNSATLGGNLCQESRCLYYNQSHAFQFVEPCFKRGGDLCYLVPKGKKCWAVFMSDLATPLLVLGAQAELVAAQGQRRVPLAELYSGDSLRPLALEPDEIVARVFVPPQPSGVGTAFVKFALRGGIEFGGFNLAARVALEAGSGACARADLVCGCIGGGPIRVGEVEKMLSGRVPTPELLGQAARGAASLLRPFPHHGYSAAYLKEVIGQEMERVLSRAWALASDRAAGGGEQGPSKG